MSELRGCPFCGSIDLIDRDFRDEDGGYYEIGCKTCSGARDVFCGVHAEDRAEAVRQWNTRVPSFPDHAPSAMTPVVQTDMLLSTLRAIADFPITDPKNLDALNMQILAHSILPDQSSDGGVEGHAPEGSVSVAVRGLRERRPRDMEAAGSQREAETGRSLEIARVREQASNCVSQDSDRIAGPAAARGRAGVETGPSEPTSLSALLSDIADELEQNRRLVSNPILTAKTIRIALNKSVAPVPPSAATSDTAIDGDTQSDLSIANSPSAKDKAVEPVALQPGDRLLGERLHYLAKHHCGDDGPRFLRKLWEGGFRLTDEPAASPEPPTVKESLQVQSPNPVVADHATTQSSSPEISDSTNSSKSSNGSPEPLPETEVQDCYPAHAYSQPTIASPKPDAVREKIDSILCIAQGRQKLGEPPHEIRADAISAILAALSRPAHGGWEEALRKIMQRANESGTGETALIDTIHAIHRLAADALARNDRGSPAT